MSDQMTASGVDLAHFSFCKLVVDDLERCAAFYRNVFGLVDFKRISHGNSATTGGPIDEVTFRPTATGGASLTLIKFVDRPAPQPGGAIMGFVTNDLTALRKRAVASGGSLPRPVRHLAEHGVEVGFVTDPEGNIVEVVRLLGADEERNA